MRLGLDGEEIRSLGPAELGNWERVAGTGCVKRLGQGALAREA